MRLPNISRHWSIITAQIWRMCALIGQTSAVTFSFLPGIVHTPAPYRFVGEYYWNLFCDRSDISMTPVLIGKAFVGELYDCIATQKKVECLDLIKKNAFFTGNGSFFYYFKMDLFCSFMITKLRWNSIHTTHHLYNTIVWLITNS